MDKHCILDRGTEFVPRTEVKTDILKEELQIYMNEFRKLDTNNHGVLTREEVAECVYCDPHATNPGCTLCQYSLV